MLWSTYYARNYASIMWTALIPSEGCSPTSQMQHPIKLYAFVCLEESILRDRSFIFTMYSYGMS